MKVRVGPPLSPLPLRWWRGLGRKRIAKIIHLELHGYPSVWPRLHYKGYPIVQLGRGHPYAHKSGGVALHRWLKSREIGRQLKTYEHVHHEHRASKTTVDLTKLKVVEAVEHGDYHYGRNFVRGDRGRFVWVSCGDEYTEQELQEMSDASTPS